MAGQQTPTDLQHLIRLFRTALEALGATPSGPQLETWSVLVHTSMSGGERDYHGVQHVFDVADRAGPVETLAALFHDTVYVQPDGYLSRQHELLFSDVIEKHAGGFTLKPYVVEQDRSRALLEAVFDLSPGTWLSPWDGLSEFLSAMLAARSLDGVLSDPLLLQVAAAIEATIPFRPMDAQGRTPPERLLDRLGVVNDAFGLGLARSELVRTVHQAVAVTNRDVAGFAFRDTGRFLDYTWQLLPESVMALRRKATYTLGEYRLGLGRMAGFLARLAPESVFCQFQGVPGAAEIAELTALAATNIRRARRYLEAKLAASSVLYALAVLTGGDAPAALFMGDLPTPGRRAMRLEDFLPDPGPLCGDGDADVFALLDDGRQNDSGFDIRNSPLAAFLYARMGEAGVTRLTADGAPPVDAASARQLLDLLPVELLQDIVHACARIAVTRADALLDLLATADHGSTPAW